MSQTLINVAKVAEISKILRIIEKTRWWMYIDVGDSKVCPDCDRFGGSVVTTSDARFWFPDLEVIDDMLWWPTIHPNCRCMLVAKAEDFNPDSMDVILSPAASFDVSYLDSWPTDEPAPYDLLDLPKPKRLDSADINYIDPRDLLGLPKHEKIVRMHDDYKRIRAAFIKAAVRDKKKAASGSVEFWKWIRKNRLNYLMPYGTVQKEFPAANKIGPRSGHTKKIE